VTEGLAAAGRDRASFECWGGGFIATGPDPDAVRKQIDEVRYRIAFYGSTRSYHGVFAVHGWEDLGMKLHQLSKQGRWNEMAREVPDEVVHTFAAVGTYGEIAKAIEARFGGVTDSIALGFPGSTAAGLVREVVQDVRRIPCAFHAFPGHKA
jgi:hypothetical protein